MTTAEITDLITSNVLSGGKRTTAAKQRELFNEMNTSFLNKESNVNTAGGYAATEEPLTEGRMPYFSSTGFLNGYLKQAGDSIILDDNKYISGSTLLAALFFGEEGSEHATLGINIIDPQPGDVISKFRADTSLARMSSSQNETESIWNVQIGGISGTVFDDSLNKLSTFNQSSFAFSFSVFDGSINYTMIETVDNSAGDVIFSANPSLPVSIGSQGSTASAGIVNSVALGGQNHNIQNSDSVYISDTYLQFGHFISGESGQASISFGVEGFETIFSTTDRGAGDGGFTMVKSDGAYIGYGYNNLAAGILGQFGNISNSGALGISLGLLNDTVKVSGIGGEIMMFDNSAFDVLLNTFQEGDKFPVYIATGGGNILQGVIGSVALGCENVDIITSHAAYVDRLIHQAGLGIFPSKKQSIITWEDVTDDRSIIIPDKSGTIAMLSDISGSGVSSVSGTANRITSSGGSTPTIDISASYPGQSSITTLGTIGTGTWEGTAIADAYISSSSTWNAKQNAITTGTTAQYFRGNLSLATFPTDLASFTNGPGYITSISGAVTSVTGTTNRITSTGGATPAIDISATFEALLGKVASPLSQFASTTSAQLAGVISDETGTGTLVFSTAPTFVTNITSPLVIGGTAVSDALTLKSSTGNGTATIAGIVLNVGNNGGTTAAQVYNSGNFNVGNASNTSARLLRVGQDTAIVDIGSLIGTTSTAAIYTDQSTPSATNYALAGTSTTTNINATTTIAFRINAAASARSSISDTQIQFTPGASSSGVLAPIIFTTPASTAQTLSTETVAFNFDMATNNIQHATGALALNRDALIQARTHRYVGASTGTDMATFCLTGPPMAGTNATHTNVHSMLIQAGAVVNGGTAVTNAYGFTCNAPTGATNNYAAQFLGGLGVLISATNIVTDTTTGMKLWTATSQKGAFWNATPIIQPASANQAALTDSTTGTPSFILVDVGAVFSQANVNNNFSSIYRVLNEMRNVLVNTGLMKGAA